MLTAIVSSKGQVTIPKKIREKYHLQPGDKLEFLEDSRGVVTLWPVTESVTKLKGMIKKPATPVSIEAMNKAIQEEGGAK